ncbi:hypothetical protein FOXYSP1_04062 [Fusarium oxysporum f. sp. phaseoli]
MDDASMPCDNLSPGVLCLSIGSLLVCLILSFIKPKHAFIITIVNYASLLTFMLHLLVSSLLQPYRNESHRPPL